MCVVLTFGVFQAYDLAPYPSPLPVSSTRDTKEDRKRETTFSQKVVGEETNHTTASLVLYKPINTLLYASHRI